jgi:hypothetical protein
VRIESALAGASQQGTFRVATVVAIVLVFVALAVGLLVWIRRRRRGASRPDPGIEVQDS